MLLPAYVVCSENNNKFFFHVNNTISDFLQRNEER